MIKELKKVRRSYVFLLPSSSSPPPPPPSSSSSFGLITVMGSKGDASSPSPSPPSPPVCCMCGDAGLPEELFRCKHCLIRSQHKYCSDLYPRSELCKACNWCLREEAAAAAAAAKPISFSSSSSDNNGSGGPVREAGTGVKLQRAAFSQQLNKPIKKQRVPERSASDVSDRLMRAAEDLSPATGRGRPGIRGKVRRYKLLEEVSS